MADEAVKDADVDVKANDAGEEGRTLPDGALWEKDVRDNWVPTALVDKRVAKAVQVEKGKLSAELLNSDDFLDRLIDLRGDDLKARLGVGEKGEDDRARLEKLQAQVREKEVKPLQEQAEQLQAANERFRAKAKRGDVLAAVSAADVADDLRELVAEWLAGRTRYDDETDSVVVLDESGEPDMVVEDGKAVPKTPRHLLDEIKKSGQKPGWFRDKTRAGAGYQGAHGARGKALKRSEMSTAEKAAYTREHGHKAFMELPA